MRNRSLNKVRHEVAWRRNQWSIVLTDDLSALVMQDAKAEETGVSNVIRRILLEHYRSRNPPSETPEQDRISPHNPR